MLVPEQELALYLDKQQAPDWIYPLKNNKRMKEERNSRWGGGRGGGGWDSGWTDAKVTHVSHCALRPGR